MVVDKRKIEREVWNVVSPVLDLPPTEIKGVTNNEGLRRYQAARRAIQELVGDPIFVKAVQDGKASFKDYLMQNIPSSVFAKLFETDIAALVPERKTKIAQQPK